MADPNSSQAATRDVTAAGAIRQQSAGSRGSCPRLRAELNAALRMLADSARHAPGTWTCLFTLGVTVSGSVFGIHAG